MILNSGLDNACTTSAVAIGFPDATAAAPPFGPFVRYAAFGTGSSAPAPTDTALDAQVGARSDSRGGFNNTLSAGVDDNSDVIWYEVTFTRAFSISSNVNATEWGLAPAASGNLSVRDLFRADPNDPMSAPITLTLENGDQLQLVITLRIQANWEYENKSFAITGTAGNDTNGTHAGYATVTSGAASSVDAIQAALQAVWPYSASESNATEREWVRCLLADSSSIGKNDNFSTPGVAQTSAPSSYTPGDFYRDSSAAFATSAANGNIYAFVTSKGGTATPAAASQGLRFILTNPPFLTKTSTHRLTLTVRKSISRL